MTRKSGTARVCDTLSYTASKQWSRPEPSSLPPPAAAPPPPESLPTHLDEEEPEARGQRPAARGPGHSKAWLGAGAQAPGLREAGVVTPDHPEMGWLQINKGKTAQPCYCSRVRELPSPTNSRSRCPVVLGFYLDVHSLGPGNNALRPPCTPLGTQLGSTGRNTAFH